MKKIKLEELAENIVNVFLEEKVVNKKSLSFKVLSILKMFRTSLHSGTPETLDKLFEKIENLKKANFLMNEEKEYWKNFVTINKDAVTKEKLYEQLKLNIIDWEFKYKNKHLNT